MHLRADDGIRTRDPHLGKVMRYQLRYIRAQRTRSSPGAKDDDSPRKRTHTNLFVRAVSRVSRDAQSRMWPVLQTPARATLRPRSHLGTGPVAQWESVRFTRGRSLVRSQPGPLRSVQVVRSDLRPTRRQAVGERSDIVNVIACFIWSLGLFVGLPYATVSDSRHE